MNLALWYRRCLWIGTGLCLVVVVLGAYVRLSDAGLGCPDWPGCYGHLVLPADEATRDSAQLAYPERPIEAGKAWREMIHRYAASSLGLVIVLASLLAWLNRRDPHQPVILPAVLLGVVIFQGLLGMWTVTLLLKPLIVMGHLLGGLTTLGLLVWLLLEARPQQRSSCSHPPPDSLAGGQRTGDPDRADRARRLDEFELRGAGLPGHSHLSGPVVAGRQQLCRGLRVVARAGHQLRIRCAGCAVTGGHPFRPPARCRRNLHGPAADRPALSRAQPRLQRCDRRRRW